MADSPNHRPHWLIVIPVLIMIAAALLLAAFLLYGRPAHRDIEARDRLQRELASQPSKKDLIIQEKEAEHHSLGLLNELYKQCLGAVWLLDQKLHNYKTLYDEKLAEIQQLIKNRFPK